MEFRNATYRADGVTHLMSFDPSIKLPVGEMPDLPLDDAHQILAAFLLWDKGSAAISRFAATLAVRAEVAPNNLAVERQLNQITGGNPTIRIV